MEPYYENISTHRFPNLDFSAKNFGFHNLMLFGKDLGETSGIFWGAGNSFAFFADLCFCLPYSTFMVYNTVITIITVMIVEPGVVLINKRFIN